MQVGLIMANADAILIERAERDFEEGLAHVREGIRATHGRIVGATLDTLLMGAIATLGVRSRMRDDVRGLLAIAHRCANGEDPRKLAEEHVDHVLRLKTKMGLIAREDDPAFQDVRRMAMNLMETRLPDLARMATVDAPADYGDIVRRAFPERAYVDAMVTDNAARIGAMIDHIEKHPHVLRAPSGMIPKLATTAREFLAWKIADVRKGVDAIYAAR